MPAPQTAAHRIRFRPSDLAPVTPKSGAPKFLERVLSDLREDLQALRRRGVALVPVEQLEHFADDIARGAEDYLRWLSEDEAQLRCGRSLGWLRRQFPEWERAGHARRDGRERYFRMLVVPQRGNTLAAREAGRRAALEGSGT
jgi:hypothetical protein